MGATSVAELPSVSDVRERLRGLLQLARRVKQIDTIQPPLPVADFTSDIDNLHDALDGRLGEVSRFYTVETAAREIFYNRISSTDIQDPEFVEVWNLLDILSICGDRGKATPELVCWLIEELLDSQTTTGCRAVFDYLESRRERLAAKDFHKKNLVFLRSCNELLRRLSRAEDAIFCGRVFFFLFQTFPLGDKSSVNLRGEFHTDNLTKFEVAAETEQNGEKMDIDSATPKPEDVATPSSKGTPARSVKKAAEEEILSNHALYPVFWRLQQDFCEPTRLFQPANFATFKKGLDATIRQFKATPTVVQTHADQGKRGTKRKAETELDDEMTGEPKGHYADNYNPKYLTSRELFDLELSDLAFQRHIMVQALILIDFLLSLTEKAKKKLATVDASNRSMLYSHTLSEEDTKWASATKKAITSYITELHSDGRYYCRMVETVLARDKNWVRWKIESCPSIVREPVSAAAEEEARKGAKDYTRPRRIPARQPPGTMDISFLEEGSGGGLEELKDPKRYTPPSIKELLDALTTNELDLDFATEDEAIQLREQMSNKRWRIMRQVRETNLALLDMVEPGGDVRDLFKPKEENVMEATAATGEDDAETNGEGTVEAENLAESSTNPDATTSSVRQTDGATDDFDMGKGDVTMAVDKRLVDETGNPAGVEAATTAEHTS